MKSELQSRSDEQRIHLLNASDIRYALRLLVKDGAAESFDTLNDAKQILERAANRVRPE